MADYSQMDNRDIICPYCFKKFKQTQTVFRSNYVYAGNSGLGGRRKNSLIDDGTSDADSSDDDQMLFSRYEGPYSRAASKVDEKLESFWENRGQGSGFVTYDPKWFYPHIDPADTSTFNRMTKREPGITDDRGFVRDKDGWIVRVLQKYGNNDLPMDKLCPHCHNPLPFSTYGKYPVKFISIVGIRGSGKTVYLYELLSRFPSVIKHTGYTMGETTFPKGNGDDRVAKSYPLPASTDDKTMRRPQAFVMRKSKARQDDSTFTIVFYDIAGENCVPPKTVGAQNTNENAISTFLAYSDGLLFLIDPEQVPIFASTENKVDEIQSVINLVNSIRPAVNTDNPSWDNVPVAAVLTKSDKLKNATDVDRLIFQHISYEENGRAITDFNRKEFTSISRALRSEFINNASQIEDSLSAFKDWAYFAVSAITCGVESRFEKMKNTYILDPENDRKFHYAREWCDGWNARDLFERGPQYYPDCPITDINGNHIPMQDEYIDKKTDDPEIAGIETSIQGYTVFPGGIQKTINLTMGDVTKDVNLLGYPSDEPNPRRVEEPFLWILWQLGLLGPEFPHTEPPQRRHFPPETKRAYEARLDEWSQLEKTREKKFYLCEDIPNRSGE